MDLFGWLFGFAENISSFGSWLVDPITIDIPIVKDLLDFLFGLFGLTDVTPLSIFTSSVLYLVVLFKLAKLIRK